MGKSKKRVTEQEQFFSKLQVFAKRIREKFTAEAHGEPEDQLRGPIDQLFVEYSGIISRKVVLKGESKLEEKLGKPDFAAHDKEILIGYIELKAPGKGANPDLFKGHDKEQWKRFKNIPNLIYTDGNEWGLYQEGKLVDQRIRLSGDVRVDGKKAVSEKNAKELFQIFTKFSSWNPIVPKKPKALAAYLAPYCRLIRDEVMDALKDPQSPIQDLKREIKNLLFPEADDLHFADAYAQTVTFALLLAQIEGANVLDLRNAFDTLESHHLLLAKVLQFLTDKQALKEMSTSVTLAQRVIHAIKKSVLKAKSDKDDPWLFFYEDFLAEYDPKLRKASGVYYTPLEIVNCQVRLIDEILSKHLGKEMGFVEPGVATLDPALGTGTYLLAIIDHAIKRIAEEEGPGAVKGGARSLVHNLHGFEWMVGPYAVAQLRFTRALTNYGTSLPANGPGIYLTNTLESPHTKPPAPPLFHKPIAKEHERALKVKDSEHVLVCLGNPPYGRHEAVTKDNHAFTGGWVRHGEEDIKDRAILEDFLEPARNAGFGRHLKNIYNHYIYFIRWSLWKVFEHKTATGPGILTFITASSYLDGDAFVGIREHMRKICDYIYIIDLGGEGRGARKEDNVFAIQTPVAIFIGWRKKQGDTNSPAIVKYTRVEGSKDEKLAVLDEIKSNEDVKWQKIPDDWQDKFIPEVTSCFFVWPKLKDVFPWQHSGVQFKRLWPISTKQKTLQERWASLVNSKNKASMFKESRDRKISKEYSDIMDSNTKLKAIVKAVNDDIFQPARYSYRSFDRQWILPDARVGDYLRPILWQSHGNGQVYFIGLFSTILGKGPGLAATSLIPDLDYFRGSYGAKAVMPLYRDREMQEANILPGLLELLGKEYDREVSAEDFAGYVYGILAQPEYTRRFSEELGNREVRFPLTKDINLFFQVAEYGQNLIWLHTYGERIKPGETFPKGNAKCLKGVPDNEEDYPDEFGYNNVTGSIFVGEGEFGPVDKEVYEFEVSGLKVVQSWLGYRMKTRKGKKSSPLDDIRPRIWTHEFTKEFLELLWVLEHTIEGYPRQKEMLEEVLAGDLFHADELPDVPDNAREAPKVTKPKKNQLEIDFPE